MPYLLNLMEIYMFVPDFSFTSLTGNLVLKTENGIITIDGKSFGHEEGGDVFSNGERSPYLLRSENHEDGYIVEVETSVSSNAIKLTNVMDKNHNPVRVSIIEDTLDFVSYADMDDEEE